MDIESLLGGGVGLALVLGNASSALVEVFGAADPISEENVASRVCNLLDTMSLILKRSLFLSLKILTIGLNLRTLDVPYRFATKCKLLLDIG